jgi:hypothetical protein
MGCQYPSEQRPCYTVAEGGKERSLRLYCGVGRDVFCAVSPRKVHYILGVCDEVQRWVAARLLGVRACLVGEVGYLCDGSSGCELWRLMHHSTVVICLGGGV